MSEEVVTRSPSLTERLLDLMAGAVDTLEDEDDQDRSRLERVAIDKFGPSVRAREDRFEDFRRKVNQARMDDTYDQYLATTILYALLAGVVGAIFGFGVGTVLSYFDVFAGVSAPNAPETLRSVFSPMLKNIAGAMLLMLVGALLFAGGTGGVRYAMPGIEAGNRDREIQELLPTTLTYMYALSDGGMPLLDIIDRLADEEATLGEVAEEFQAVQNNMAFLGNDLKTSLRNCRSTTPNDEIGELFDDLVSLIDSGGDLTPFFEDKVAEYQRRNRREQEAFIESLELVATGYTVIGVLFPLLLIVIITVFAAIGSVSNDPLYAIIYVGLPIISAAFLVVVDSMTADDTGTANTLPLEDEKPSAKDIRRRLEAGTAEATVTDGGTVNPNQGITDRRTGHDGALDPREQQLLGQLNDTLRRERVLQTLGQPLRGIRRQPLYSLVFTVPVALLYMALMAFTGLVSYSLAAITSDPWFVTTVGLLVPILLILTPVSYYHERKYRYNRRAEKELPAVLGTLASTNASGATLIESLELVAESSYGPLATELEGLGRELQWNVSLDSALRRFTNRVRNRRVTRMFKLLIESSTASDRVTEVLKVTEKDAKFAREMDKKRLETLQVIMGIILFGFIVFLGVMAALVIRLFPPFAEAAAASEARGALGAWTFDPNLYTMLFYHGILLQAFFGGLVAAKFGHDNAWIGVKFSIGGMLLAAGVFLLI